jgi:hypothetical protein
MTLKWGRILIATIVAEIVPLAALVAIVAVTIPPDVENQTAYAAGIGQWVGPIGGALMAFLGGLWVGRRLTRDHVVSGALVGVLLAVIDLVSLIALSAPFAWIFVISNGSKIICAALGGLVAARVFQTRAAPQ